MPRTLASFLTFVLLIAFLSGLSLRTLRADEPAKKPATEKPATEKPAPGKQVVQHAKIMDQDVGFWLFLPADYGKGDKKKWPVMLFLHGAGERGDDLKIVKKHGPPKIVDSKPDFPFIVISPQCPAGKRWDESVLSQLLDDVLPKYSVDLDRVYVTGLSMGGYGTWTLAIAHPNRFAAIIPICGGGDPKMVHTIKGIPTWVFHGAKDTAVSLKRSEEMVDALKAAGGTVQLTVYPEAGHDSWTETYNNPKVYAWLLEHKRGG